MIHAFFSQKSFQNAAFCSPTLEIYTEIVEQFRNKPWLHTQFFKEDGYMHICSRLVPWIDAQMTGTQEKFRLNVQNVHVDKFDWITDK